VRRALRASSLLHALTVLSLAGLAPLAGLGWIYVIGLGLTAAFLFYERSLVSAADLSRLNLAFFQVNAWVSVLIFVSVLADLLLRTR
jgi:4-hydroxybenzoate polyprenyltransferase